MAGKNIMAFDTNTHSILAKALGVDGLPEDKKEAMIESAGAIVYQAVLTKAMEELPEEALDEFEKIINAEPTPELVFAFFRSNIMNFDSMIEEEAKAFIEDGQNIMNQIGE